MMRRLVVIAAITTLAAAKDQCSCANAVPSSKSVDLLEDAFAKRGYAAEADRIQELFLGGRRDEAAAAVPDEYVDEEILIGPPARIRERFALWRDSGFTTLRVSTDREDVLELVARENDR